MDMLIFLDLYEYSHYFVKEQGSAIPGQKQERCSQQTGSQRWLWHQRQLHQCQIPQSPAHKEEC